MINNLDEAIVHAREVAKELKQKHSDLLEQPKFDRQAVANCWECSREHEQLASWLTELVDRREADKWIPVSEKLPEDFCLYEVTSEEKDGKHIYIFYFNPISKNFICAYPECITAWRPLPEPYKESEANNETNNRD